jgi:hypothetical protein
MQRQLPSFLSGCVCSIGLVLALVLSVIVPGIAGAAGACPNEAFRTGPSAALPDCRAYEMVTPVYKEGFPVTAPFGGFSAGPRRSTISKDGASVAGESFGDFAGAGNSEFGSFDEILAGAQYLFTRGASGWTTAATELPAPQFPVSALFAYNPGFSSSVWAAASPSQFAASQNGPAGAQADFYLRRSDGSTADIGPLVPRNTSPAQVTQGYFQYAGASEDLSRVFYTLAGDYWPGPSTLYEYIGTGNSAPLQVGVSPGVGSTSLISICGTDLGSRSHETFPVPKNRNAVSAPSKEHVSGEHVFFTAIACASGPKVDELYARVKNGEPKADTVAISEPTKKDCEACHTETAALQNAYFVGASADGSKVFFTTSQPLLGGDSTQNIYEYDFNAPEGVKVMRVSSGDSTVSNPLAGVLVKGSPSEAGSASGVAGVSNDGSHVYFAATGVLTTAPNSQGQIAHEGADNLYLFERDASYPNGRTAFITSLSEADSGVWGRESLGLSGEEESSMSENGRFLVFTSHAQLTPDDTSLASQAFEYDSLTGALTRVSVGQSGFNDDGNTSSELAAPHGVVIADDGAVFFESSDGLTPQALNGHVIELDPNHIPILATNVYEYRAGNVYLISDGQDLNGAKLLGIDESGENVFFTTFDQLLPQDGDTQRDTYDARIDGGFPRPVAPSPCAGDACQGLLSGAPTLLSPGSEFQAGATRLPPLLNPSLTVKKKPKARKRARRKKKGRKTSARRRPRR